MAPKESKTTMKIYFHSKKCLFDQEMVFPGIKTKINTYERNPCTKDYLTALWQIR